MKKSIFILFMSLVSINFSHAGSFSANDAAIDQAFSESEDITLSLANEVSSVEGFNALQLNAGDDKTVGGFLIRSFFCGSIALHRYYMGTNGESMWWKYLCIPVVGGVTGCVDFWWVVFSGKDAMEKFRDNSKYMVWTGN